MESAIYTTICLLYPEYIRNIVRLLSHGPSNLYHHMSIKLLPASLASNITGPKALLTNLSAMSPDFFQPIANITYYRPHGLINMLSNKQPLFPDHGPRLTLPKLPREPTGCASPGAAGGTQHPSPCPRPCHALLSYCLLSDIPGLRLISREDAHPMYPRYLRVFLFLS